jgi:hypothetical protein
MSRNVLFLCLTAASALAASAFSQSFLSQYKGLPYHDSRYQGIANALIELRTSSTLSRYSRVPGYAECAGINRHVVGDARALQERK